MSVRYKFLLLFLVFSLAPLLVVTFVGQRGIVRMGEAISALAKVNRTAIVSRELQQTAEDYAKILGREKEVLELTLRIIARDAERFLSEPPKGIAKLYFARDYDNPVTAPRDLTISPKYKKGASGERDEPLPVSLNHQVFFLRPESDNRAAARDASRLSRLLPLHQEFQSQLADILYWQYVSLESGVHAAYPGHGGYPTGYNPQNRPWYTSAKKRGTLVWSRPYIDATTRQVIMSASMVVRHSDGSFAGVAAIDVLLSKVLQINELSSQWSPSMRSFVVWSGVREDTGEEGLWVVARKDYVENVAAWSGVMGLERLTSSDPTKITYLEGEIRALKSGYVEMDYYGVDSVWAYAHAGDNVYLVLIVPKNVILKHFEQVHQTLHSLVKEQWLFTGVVAIGVILLLFLAGLWFAHAMIRPLFVMVEAVKRLAKGDFSARIDINTGDERDLLAKSFNEMVPQLKDRMQMRKSLEVAKEIQQNLLPQEIPNLRGFDIAAKSVYCDETGGDYFDFFPCEDDHCSRFGIAVGDVTGHGVGAALLMATARALIRGLVTRPENLADCLTQVNSLLSTDVRDTGRFMSLFFLLIEEGSRNISWVRAGHDPAILFDPARETVEELMGPGMVLGVEEDYCYEQVDKGIETAGTIIFIGTDGIWEAHNFKGELFGKDRLYQIIRDNADKSAGAIQGAVLDAVGKFRGSVPQEDDITLVVIKIM
jgi:sigma-B regulation protein RsbU (phosphoserine phosphatase)